MTINEMLNEMIIKNDEIGGIARAFYLEGGFDDIPLGEMIFSCAKIAGYDI